MTPTRPPVGIRLVADPGLRRVGGGRILIGGAPLRIIRLSAPGAAVVDAWLGGAPLADVHSARDLARRLLDAGMLHPAPTPTPAPPAATVVVPVRDDPDGLDRLLAGVDLPVVVVDDGSVDDTAIARVGLRHGARVIRRAEAGGPAAARTTGLESVDTPLVVFVDADVELTPHWWERLAAHFDDDAVVAVAPRVRSRPGPTLLERYEAEHSPLDLGPTPARVGPGRPVSYVPSAVLAVRRVALDRHGGFDPRLRFGEDVDLVWRLAGAGATVRYEPGVTVLHEPRPTWPAWVRQRVAYGSSAAPLAARHGSAVAPARCSRWSLAAWVAVLLGRPGAGAAIAVGSSVPLVRRLRSLPDPAGETVRLAGLGHLWAGVGLGRAVSRVWWPVLVPLALRWRRLRPGVVVALLGPAVHEWVGGRRPAGPVRSVALRLADDMAYGVGVWGGVLRARDARALRPDLTEWPGARDPVEAGTVGTP